MYYFASDIHLGAAGENISHRTELRFVDWLEKVSADAEAIFLVGDVFDFWFEYRRVVPKGFTRTLGKISSLTDRGIRVVFFTGNHDMWVRDYLQKECGMEVYTSSQRVKLSGKSIFIAHGDNMNIDNKPMLKFMNTIFRSKTLYFLFSWLVHPDLALKFGNWWSGKSRKAHCSGLIDHSVTNPLIEYARTYKTAHPDTDYFIFGHMHVARDYSDTDLRVLMLGEWEYSPVYARLDKDGNISLEKI